MTGEPLANATRCIGVFDCSDREAVIAHNALFSATDDVSLSAARFLVDQRVALQKAVKRFFAAIKRIDFVRGVELSDGREQLVLRRHSSTLFSARSLARRGLL